MYSAGANRLHGDPGLNPCSSIQQLLKRLNRSIVQRLISIPFTPPAFQLCDTLLWDPKDWFYYESERTITGWSRVGTVNGTATFGCLQPHIMHSRGSICAQLKPLSHLDVLASVCRRMKNLVNFVHAQNLSTSSAYYDVCQRASACS